MAVDIERGQSRRLLFGAAASQPAVPLGRWTPFGDFVQLAADRFDFGGAGQPQHAA